MSDIALLECLYHAGKVHPREDKMALRIEEHLKGALKLKPETSGHKGRNVNNDEPGYNPGKSRRGSLEL